MVVAKKGLKYCFLSRYTRGQSLKSIVSGATSTIIIQFYKRVCPVSVSSETRNVVYCYVIFRYRKLFVNPTTITAMILLLLSRECIHIAREYCLTAQRSSDLALPARTKKFYIYIRGESDKSLAQQKVQKVGLKIVRHCLK